MLSGTTSPSSKNKKRPEPTITRPEITSKKLKLPTEKSEAKVKIHESISKPHEPTFSKSNSRLKSPRQKFNRSNDNYIIDLNNYQILSQSKDGVIGYTNFIISKKSNRQYTAKTSPTQFNSQNPQLILREVNLLVRAQHPTIIRIQGFSYTDFQGQDNLTILMEFVQKGPLSDFIEKVDQSLFDNTKRQIILVGIARGMMILHKRHILHRDLKPENILLDDNFHPKITNFGLSKLFELEKSWILNLGSIAYMAPEVLENNRFSPKSDVYAFGILMFELITNGRAFKKLFESNEFNSSDFKENVINGLRPEFTFSIKEGLKKIIEKCLSQNPNDRPTFSELFCKLSLSDEEAFTEFDEDIKIIDESNNQDKLCFCLDDVNLDQLFNYIDEIEVEISAPQQQQQQQQIKQEDVEQLIARNNEISRALNDHKKKISYLSKYVSSLKEDNSKLKDQNLQLTRENIKLESYNKRLKEEVAQLSSSSSASTNNAKFSRQINRPSENSQQPKENRQTEIEPLVDQSSEIQQPDNENNNKAVTLNNQTEKHESDPNEILKSIDQISSEKIQQQQQQKSDGDQISKEIKNRSISPSIHKLNSPENCNDQISQETQTKTMTTAELPLTSTSILPNMFQFCRRLQEVKIPPSVTSIGHFAFHECISLRSIEIPQNVASIGDYSFCLCSLLDQISIQSNLTSIGSHAFSRCSSLKNLVIPSSVSLIGSSAFSWCTSLTKFEIPSNLKRIEESTFFGCTSLLCVKIPSSVESIGFDAFYKCSSLVDVEIPDSVSTVGKSAFNGCLSLEKVKISPCLTKIDEYTFFQCCSLKNIDIPSSVKIIGKCAFSECDSMTSVKIPSSVESIENDSFPSETQLIK